MPGANEVLGCPRIFFQTSSLKIFSIRLTQFLTTFFQISRNFAPWIPPSAASCPGNDIFLFFFSYLPTFFYENWPLECPPGWMPGAVAPAAPLSLHATVRIHSERESLLNVCVRLLKTSRCVHVRFVLLIGA